VAAYLEHRHLRAAEVPVERFFMDVAMARLVCVHALVIRPRLAVAGSASARRNSRTSSLTSPIIAEHLTFTEDQGCWDGPFAPHRPYPPR
jgi:hypothetical protein